MSTLAEPVIHSIKDVIFGIQFLTDSAEITGTTLGLHL